MAGGGLKIRKKDRTETIIHVEALDVALCHGWIDGQKNGYDDLHWLQRSLRTGLAARGPSATGTELRH